MPPAKGRIKTDHACVDALVLEACRSLQADGVYPSIEQVRRIVGRAPKSIGKSRKRLVDAGELRITVVNPRSAGSSRRVARRPRRLAAPAPRPRPTPRKNAAIGPLAEWIEEHDRRERARARWVNEKRRAMP